MRSTRVPSIVCATLAVIGGFGASSGCALEEGSSAVPGTGGAGAVTTDGSSVTSGAGTPTGTPTTIGTTTTTGTPTTSGTASGVGGSGTTGVASSTDGATTTVGTGGMMSGVGGGSTDGAMSTMGSVGGAASGSTDGATTTEGGGGSGGGECVVGQTRGDEVVMIGESFIAFTHQITQQVETRAQSNGSLANGERYIDNSVSGTTLANNQIPSQYTDAVEESGFIRYVLMDGGGNDCLINNNGAAALTAATSLFQTMAANGTEKVVYFFYPDPIGGNFASLKSCLDELRPQMKEICDNLTAPKCYWLDLREIWDGHPEYTSDGIHPTTEGSIATGNAIWDVMVENCVAQ